MGRAIVSGTLAAAALLALLGVAGAAAPGRGGSDALPLRVVTDVALPGPSSRFDYLSLDRTRGRLYVAHLGADRLTIVDTRRRTVVGRVRGLAGVHGVLVVPELGRVFASAFDRDELVTIDQASGRVLARARTGRRPDNIAYHPGTRRVFVADLLGGTVTVVDARSGKRVGTVAVGGLVGNVQYDAASGRMLVNAQSRGELAWIGARSLRVVKRTRLRGCGENHGLAVDAARRLAFVGCQLQSRLAVVDLRRGRVVACPTVGRNPDQLAFDPGLRRVYVASESGVVAVFAAGATRVRELGRGFVARGAHAVAVDPATHLVYLPLASVRGRPALRIMAPRRLTAAAGTPVRAGGCPVSARPAPAPENGRDGAAMRVSVVMTEGEMKLSTVMLRRGPVVFEVESRGFGAHSFVIPDLGVQTRPLEPGERAVLRVTFRTRGSFQYWCGVGKHSELGEAGLLHVR